MKPANRAGTKGKMETSKMLLNNSCLELYYFVYGENNATVSVFAKNEVSNRLLYLLDDSR